MPVTVKGDVSVVGNRGVYIGNTKGGQKYASGSFMVKNPKGYGHWVSFYAPGQPAEILNGAQEHEVFEVEGYLDEAKYKDKNGQDARKEQIVVTSARRAMAVNDPKRGSVQEQYINDQDIPF